MSGDGSGSGHPPDVPKGTPTLQFKNAAVVLAMLKIDLNKDPKLAIEMSAKFLQEAKSKSDSLNLKTDNLSTIESLRLLNTLEVTITDLDKIFERINLLLNLVEELNNELGEIEGEDKLKFSVELQSVISDVRDKIKDIRSIKDALIFTKTKIEKKLGNETSDRTAAIVSDKPPLSHVPSGRISSVTQRPAQGKSGERLAAAVGLDTPEARIEQIDAVMTSVPGVITMLGKFCEFGLNLKPIFINCYKESSPLENIGICHAIYGFAHAFFRVLNVHLHDPEIKLDCLNRLVGQSVAIARSRGSLSELVEFGNGIEESLKEYQGVNEFVTMIEQKNLLFDF